jgi:hypothetical protein
LPPIVFRWLDEEAGSMQEHKERQEEETRPSPYRPFSWPRRWPAVLFLVLGWVVLLLVLGGITAYQAWKIVDLEQRIERLEGTGR